MENKYTIFDMYEFAKMNIYKLINEISESLINKTAIKDELDRYITDLAILSYILNNKELLHEYVIYYSFNQAKDTVNQVLRIQDLINTYCDDSFRYYEYLIEWYNIDDMCLSELGYSEYNIGKATEEEILHRAIEHYGMQENDYEHYGNMDNYYSFYDQIETDLKLTKKEYTKTL